MLQNAADFVRISQPMRISNELFLTNCGILYEGA